MNFRNNLNNYKNHLINNFESNDGNNLLNKAQKHYLKGNFKACIKLCEQFQGSEKNKALSRVLIAACTNNPEEQYFELIAALELDPGCANAYFALGQYYFDKENFTEAIDCYKKHLNLIESEVGYIQIINSYIRINNYNYAHLYACDGKRKFSNSSEINFLLAAILVDAPADTLSSAEFTDVIKYLSIAEKGGIEKENILYYEGIYYYNKMEYQNAIKPLNLYLAINSENSTLRWYHIVSLHNAGFLIDFLGFLFKEYYAKVSIAIDYVEKYNFLDFEDEIHNGELTEEQQDDLLNRINERMKNVVNNLICNY